MLKNLKNLFLHLKQQYHYNIMFKPGIKHMTMNKITGKTIDAVFTKDYQKISIKDNFTNYEKTAIFTDLRRYKKPVTYLRKRTLPENPVLTKENSWLKIY